MTRHTIGDTRYDYDRQCWVMYAGDGQWEVLACGHTADHKASRGGKCCYAGQHAGELVRSDIRE